MTNKQMLCVFLLAGTLGLSGCSGTKPVSLEAGAYATTTTSVMHLYNVEKLSPAQKQFIEGMQGEVPELADAAAICVSADSGQKILTELVKSTARMNCDFGSAKLDGTNEVISCALARFDGKKLPVDIATKVSAKSVKMTIIDKYDSSGDERGNIATKYEITANHSGPCSSR